MTTAVVVAFGVRGAAFVAVPTIAVAAMLLVVTPYLLSFAPVSRKTVEAGVGEDRIGAIALLLAIVTIRSIAWFGLITFVPLYEVSIGNSKGYGNTLALVHAACRRRGHADRRAGRPIASAAARCSSSRAWSSRPRSLCFIGVGGVPGAIALVLVGMAVVGTFSVTMVMSQEYMPRHIGMASGLSIGFSIGLGGIAAVCLGALADSVDLSTALWVCAAVPLAGAALTLFLPPTRTRARLAPEIAAP